VIRGFRPGDEADRQLLINEAFDSHESLDDARRWVDWTFESDNFHDLMAQPGYGDYAVVMRDTGALVGAIGLVPTMIPWGVFPEFRPTNTPAHSFTTPEYGLFWAVRTHARGRGYATEAAKAFIQKYVCGVLNAARAVAMTEFENKNSQRVMEKLGMRLYRNPQPDPFWFQVVGVLDNPLVRIMALKARSKAENLADLRKILDQVPSVPPEDYDAL